MPKCAVCIGVKEYGSVLHTLFEVLAGNLALQIACGCGAMALGVSVGLLVQVMCLRLRSIRRRRRWLAAVAHWRPMLLRAACGEVVHLPALPVADTEAVLLLWNQLQETLRGTAHEALNRLAEPLGLPALANEALHSSRLQMQLLGISTVAHLGRQADMALMAQRLGDARAVVSLAAARALVRMDSTRWVPTLIEHFLQRPDWSVSRMATMLQEPSASVVSEFLAERLRQGTPAQQARLLALAPMMKTIEQARVIEGLLHVDAHPVVLAEALTQVRSPGALHRVRALTLHAQWQVRAQAALALGRIGQLEDRRQLVTMLSDAQWWVRYRAAGALLSLPGVDVVDVVALCTSLKDRFARDILAHVAAERAVMSRAR
jgi:HEAT repeat protein